jgi:transcriptional regulator with XRE-family HTH domain
MRYIMPAKAPLTQLTPDNRMRAFANRIRQRRLALGVSVVVAAYSAGMSRVTWHRIETGEPSVTMGAYLGALDALGLDIDLKPRAAARQAPIKQVPQASHQDLNIPLQIPIRNYPQLRQIAWHIREDFELTPEEAFGLYERNRRHLEIGQMQTHELELFNALENSWLKGAYGI